MGLRSTVLPVVAKKAPTGASLLKRARPHAENGAGAKAIEHALISETFALDEASVEKRARTIAGCVPQPQNSALLPGRYALRSKTAPSDQVAAAYAGKAFAQKNGQLLPTSTISTHNFRNTRLQCKATPAMMALGNGTSAPSSPPRIRRNVIAESPVGQADFLNFGSPLTLRPSALRPSFEDIFLLSKPLSSDASGDSKDGPSWQLTARATLQSLKLENFKLFKNQVFSFKEAGLVCIVGSNSSGKSSLQEALCFVLGRGHFNPESLLRRGKPACSSARVVAEYLLETGGIVSLAREVKRSAGAGASFTITCFVSDGCNASFREVSDSTYSLWIEALRLFERDLLLPQFGLMDSRNATKLLQLIPLALEKAEESSTVSAPLLKRRSGCSSASAKASEWTATRTKVAAEAWLSRRIDEVYRELTREPLDEKMEEWGEGGQACLRRLGDGSFDLFTSERRGAAACGYGTSLSSLSDGDKDVCALALLLALPGLLDGLTETLPGFVVLDEPDSRLDKQHAKALRRFLMGPSGPKQCIWLSLSNHSAFEGEINLDKK